MNNVDSVVDSSAVELRDSKTHSIDNAMHGKAIHHFFQEYKVLESGKSVWGFAWSDRVAAELEIEKALQRGAHTPHT